MQSQARVPISKPRSFYLKMKMRLVLISAPNKMFHFFIPGLPHSNWNSLAFLFYSSAGEKRRAWESEI